MNLAAVLAALVQLHVCASTSFQRPDGALLDVIICPVAHAAPDAPSDDPDQGPPKPGQKDG